MQKDDVFYSPVKFSFYEINDEVIIYLNFEEILVILYSTEQILHMHRSQVVRCKK